MVNMAQAKSFGEQEGSGVDPRTPGGSTSSVIELSNSTKVSAMGRRASDREKRRAAKLVELAADVHAGRVRRMKVRTLFGLFNLKRRRETGIAIVRQAISQFNLNTEPDLTSAGFDEQIHFLPSGPPPACVDKLSMASLNYELRIPDPMNIFPLETINLPEGTFAKHIINDSYNDEARACILSATRKLSIAEHQPVMLLGKVQSGKTKTFLGILALAFDNGWDIGVIFTKGTRALSEQTLRRLRTTFGELVEDDEIRIYDIMHVPDNLPPRDLRRKILVVVKKEDDNLIRLESFLFDNYPELANRRILIVDDEADLASIGFRGSKHTGISVARIPDQINRLRSRLANHNLLQVTATPYSLYLQPAELLHPVDSSVFEPLKPAFTEIMPIHDKYIGGDTYFVESQEPGSVASFMHCEVPDDELVALARQDARRLKLNDVLTSPKCARLRQAILDFVVGAAIRRCQQHLAGQRKKRYSMVVHTAQSKESHRWQREVTGSIIEGLIAVSHSDLKAWKELVESTVDRLWPAITASSQTLPELASVLDTATDLIDGIRTDIVNSDRDVFQMLDDKGQLKLESALTVFIGGQILDRGLTIDGMICFYYGRNPKSFQQDVVLQHSRMYGARPFEDLPVTRFYTSSRLHGVMTRIHEFDHSLRVALERDGDQGVAFIMQERGLIRPCAPNKVMLSTLTSLTPKKRLLPVGFQTKAPSIIQRKIEELDGHVDTVSRAGQNPDLIDVEQAEALARSTIELLDFSGLEVVFDEQAFLAALRYLSNECRDPALKGKVQLLVRKGRNASRVLEHGRLSNVPFSGDDAHIANRYAISIPVLMMLRQEGKTSEGWKGAPFYWPVLQSPENMRPVVFSGEIIGDGLE